MNITLKKIKEHLFEFVKVATVYITFVLVIKYFPEEFYINIFFGWIIAAFYGMHEGFSSAFNIWINKEENV